MNSAIDSLLARMNEVRQLDAPVVAPRDAATVMLIDRSGGEAKVLMGRRHEGHKFMPGKFVFPGGRVEQGDASMTALNELPDSVVSKIAARPRDDKVPSPRAFALAAIRETFEETGLLVGQKSGNPLSAAAPNWQGFADAGIIPDLSKIFFIARAITPPGRPKRFDTRFFTMDAQSIAGRVDGVVGPNSELVELVWIPIEKATTIDISPITAVILEELGHRVEAGMDHGLPVPFWFMEGGKFRRELV